MSIRNALITLLSRSLRPFFRQRPFPQSPAAILVLKPCCLGDLINATPALAALRHDFPQARIDVAVGRWSRAVLANNPHVNQLIDSGPVGQGPYRWRDVWHLARRLRAGHYTAAVVLDRSPLVALAPLLARIPYRLGLDSEGRGFAHTTRLAVPRAPCHEALLYLACVRAAREPHAAIPPAPPGQVVNPTGFWTGFYPAGDDRQALAKVLAAALGGKGAASAPLAILHPAGGVNPGMTMLAKRWPPDRYAALGDRLAERGLTVVLTGTEAEAPLCVEIAVQMRRWPLILAGQLTLGQFGALCQQARLFVGGDTGATHLAAACGCPTVAIFGPSDPARYAPFAPAERALVLWRQVPLPPGGVGGAPLDRFDWGQGVTVDEAWQACQRMLAAAV